MTEDRAARPYNPFWTTTDNRPENPTLIAARRLAERGLGIRVESTAGYNGAPHPLTVAIYCETPQDKQILRDVAFSDPLDPIRKARIEKMGNNRISLPPTHQIEALVNEAIEKILADQKVPV